MQIKEILIVEDESVIALMLKQYINSTEEYRVKDAVKKGEDAIKKVKENPPDLVIMDIKLLGELSGVDTMRQIRSFSDVPVIFTTGNSDKQHLNEIYSISKSAVLIKPIDLNDLSRVASMLLGGSFPK